MVNPKAALNLACLLLVSSCAFPNEGSEASDAPDEFAATFENLTGGVATSSAMAVQINDGCSGTLLNPRTVLTAAHCFDHDGGEQVVRLVRIEATEKSPGSYKYTRVCAVKDMCEFEANVIIHPDSDDHPKNDLALIVLKNTSVPLPVSLAPLLRAIKSHSKGKYTFLSWGPRSEDDTSKGKLHMATVNIEKFESTMATDKIYTLDEVHPCHGDSGAPLLYETATINKNFRQVVGAVLVSGYHPVAGSIGENGDEDRRCMSSGEAYYPTTYNSRKWIADNADRGCKTVTDSVSRTFLDCSY